MPFRPQWSTGGFPIELEALSYVKPVPGRYNNVLTCSSSSRYRQFNTQAPALSFALDRPPATSDADAQPQAVLSLAHRVPKSALKRGRTSSFNFKAVQQSLAVCDSKMRSRSDAVKKVRFTLPKDAITFEVEREEGQKAEETELGMTSTLASPGSCCPFARARIVSTGSEERSRKSLTTSTASSIVRMSLSVSQSNARGRRTSSDPT